VKPPPRPRGIVVTVSDHQSRPVPSERAVTQVVRRVLHAEGRRRGEVEVAFVDDTAIARVHSEFLDDPDPTDILTFNLADAGEKDIRGELVISVDHAAEQALERGLELRDELMLYVVHGVLHLCGYDDAKPADFRRMHAREDELLTALGIGPVYAAGINASGLMPKAKAAAARQAAKVPKPKRVKAVKPPRPGVKTATAKLRTPRPAPGAPRPVKPARSK